MRKREPYRRWSDYMKNVSIWFLVTIGVFIATAYPEWPVPVFKGIIFKGIDLAMDHFLKDDRFYEGIAASVGISACGTAVLFGVVFILIRRIVRYPRRKFKGLKRI